MSKMKSMKFIFIWNDYIVILSKTSFAVSVFEALRYTLFLTNGGSMASYVPYPDMAQPGTWGHKYNYE